MYETYRKFAQDHCTSAIQTYTEAVKWCEKAAELGCADAMEALAEVRARAVIEHNIETFVSIAGLVCFPCRYHCAVYLF